MRCGLLGRTLAHSYSPRIHHFLGDYSYELFEVEPENLSTFLLSNDFTGINVTIPYKKAVMDYLDECTPVAQQLQAVNTIVRHDGKRIGHNTDYFGFHRMLQQAGLQIAGKKALVLGSGGASNTAVAVLKEWGADVVVISRTGENNYHNLHLHSDAALIVNTTPVGMYPQTDQAPLSLDGFPVLEGVLDVIYNPARTPLLQEAEQRGLVALNGLIMLVAQAKEAAQWFTQTAIPDTKIQQIHRILKNEMENIVLVGMPGCGKSTLGALLAKRTGKRCVDADLLIEEMAGCSIAQIFKKEGEAGFRIWETRALTQLGKQSGLIIATGGGCVTREENYPLLHQNGTIFWLQRDLEKLPTEGRPLSQNGRLQQLFLQRQPLYRRFADHIIDNNGTLEVSADAILRILEENV